MPQKKYIVRLTAQEREVCRQTVRKLSGGSERVRRAQVPLKADAEGPAWTDQQIACRPPRPIACSPPPGNPSSGPTPVVIRPCGPPIMPPTIATVFSTSLRAQ